MTQAVIYIRSSTERQAEKVSPQVQEKECRELAQARGYEVVQVYQDIEKYRVGSRMVEPSGRRADRPALKQMLSDARSGLFDVVLSWKEDRLYRGLRAMLDVIDCIDATGIDIELVKETFDKRIAPVKAWAARMELDSKRDRTMAGIAARLAEGKPWNNQNPYGYDKNEEGFYIINEDESQWIEKVFRWYVEEDLNVREIRRRLVAHGAPQRRNSKYAWNMQLIRKYLRERYYWQGYTTAEWNGETYEIPLPPIVSEELGLAALEKKAQYKHYPAGNAQHDCLAAGLVYCEVCETRASLATVSQRTRADGSKYRWKIYECNNRSSMNVQGCFRTMSAAKLDRIVWHKLWNLISKPAEFERRIQARIDELALEETDAEGEIRRIEGELEQCEAERLYVISLARKKIIKESDLAAQLTVLDEQEKALSRELSQKRLLTGNRAESLRRLAASFRAEIDAGAELLTATDLSEEEKKEQVEFRRRLVQAIVTKVVVGVDREITVYASIGAPEDENIAIPLAW